MKKLLSSTLFFIGLMTNVANAEEISIAQFAAIFQLETSDDASVVGALTNFAQSDCRKNMPREPELCKTAEKIGLDSRTCPKLQKKHA